jgi:hypothetical protein
MMSTAEQLLSADIKESSARHKRYWQASSLPTLERHREKPKYKSHRRDRVLKRIISLKMRTVIDGLGNVLE